MTSKRRRSRRSRRRSRRSRRRSRRSRSRSRRSRRRGLKGLVITDLPRPTKKVGRFNISNVSTAPKPKRVGRFKITTVAKPSRVAVITDMRTNRTKQRAQETRAREKEISDFKKLLKKQHRSIPTIAKVGKNTIIAIPTKGRKRLVLPSFPATTRPMPEGRHGRFVIKSMVTPPDSQKKLGRNRNYHPKKWTPPKLSMKRRYQAPKRSGRFMVSSVPKSKFSWSI